ncbi:MAG TPA: hypothetical protein VIV11_13240 [Kofleriaceae bacterium]
MSRTATAPKLPPHAVCCPLCGSPDTAKYKWPDDPQAIIFQDNHPETRVCVDCRHVWWRE